MYIIDSYKDYTITHQVNSGKWFITYPNDAEASVYTKSLEKAYKFIDEMEEEKWKI